MKRFRGIKQREIMTTNLTPGSHISQFQAVVEFSDFEYAIVAACST